MAKKSLLERELKRKKLIKKYKDIRELLKYKIKHSTTIDERKKYYLKIQKLPRNSALNRHRNRCWKSGRPRGYFRFFGLCRNVLREFALDCFLPGITKSSW
jgi:small subunit ribosomal protein S14